MARVSAILDAVRSALNGMTVTSYAQGLTLDLDETLTGDLIDHQHHVGHLVYKVEPTETTGIERGDGTDGVQTSIEVQVMYRLREHLGSGGKETDIDGARDLAEDIASTIADLDDTGGDWSLRYVRHAIQGPNDQQTAVVIRCTFQAVHQLGA